MARGFINRRPGVRNWCTTCYTHNLNYPTHLTIFQLTLFHDSCLCAKSFAVGDLQLDVAAAAAEYFEPVELAAAVAEYFEPVELAAVVGIDVAVVPEPDG